MITYFFKTSVIISVLEYDILESWDLIKMRFSFKVFCTLNKIEFTFSFCLFRPPCPAEWRAALGRRKDDLHLLYSVYLFATRFSPKAEKKLLVHIFGRLGHIVLFILTKAVNDILNRRGRYRYLVLKQKYSFKSLKKITTKCCC